MGWIILIATFVFIGCKSPPDRIAYNTIASVEQTASVAVDGYYSLVIQGTVKTNGLPDVSLKFNQLQAAATVAANVGSAGTNSLAPAALVQELADLTAFISTLETKK